MQKQAVKQYLGTGLGQRPQTLVHALLKIDTKEIVFIDKKIIFSCIHGGTSESLFVSENQSSNIFCKNKAREDKQPSAPQIHVNESTSFKTQVFPRRCTKSRRHSLLTGIGETSYIHPFTNKNVSTVEKNINKLYKGLQRTSSTFTKLLSTSGR